MVHQRIVSMLESSSLFHLVETKKRNEEIKEHPHQELKYGLDLLITKPIYKDRYKKFIGPLVYHPSPATWEQAIQTVVRMGSEWL